MSALSLDAKALEAYLPHRGVNLFPDLVEISADRKSAISHTRIGRDDPRGRNFIGRRDGQGTLCWSETFLAELMALTGVPLTSEQLSPNGQVAVFSMISKINFNFLPPLDQEVVGHAKITRESRGFTQYSTSATCNGKTILEAEVLSGASTFAEITKAPVRPLAHPDLGKPLDSSLFRWKEPSLCFVDRIISSDKTSGRIVCSYTYPTDHTFVAGHFPEAPLMMGVTQWSAALDAVWAARKIFGINTDVIAQVSLMREGVNGESGAQILDVRDLVLGTDGETPVLRSTKRLAFREPVRPGDGFHIEATVLPAPSTTEQ